MDSVGLSAEAGRADVFTLPERARGRKMEIGEDLCATGSYVQSVHAYLFFDLASRSRCAPAGGPLKSHPLLADEDQRAAVLRSFSRSRPARASRLNRGSPSPRASA